MNRGVYIRKETNGWFTLRYWGTGHAEGWYRTRKEAAIAIKAWHGESTK